MVKLWRLSRVLLVSGSLVGAFALSGVASAQEAATFNLAELNGSGISGTATITRDDAAGNITVSVTLDGSGAGPQPIHIHPGTCADLDPTPQYPLTSVENGVSETVVEVMPEDLMASPFAINVHQSPEEASVYVACGDLVEANMVAMEGEAATTEEETMTEEAAMTEEGGMGPGELPATGEGDGNWLLIGLAAALGAGALGAGFVLRRRNA